MMLPIGSLLFKVLGESYAEMARVEKQFKETKNFFHFADSISADTKTLI